MDFCSRFFNREEIILPKFYSDRRMDIPGLSIALAQTKVQGDFSVAMLSKAMDLGETLGDGMVEMLDAAAMERSVTPYIGGNIDITV